MQLWVGNALGEFEAVVHRAQEIGNSALAIVPRDRAMALAAKGVALLALGRLQEAEDHWRLPFPLEARLQLGAPGTQLLSMPARTAGAERGCGSHRWLHGRRHEPGHDGCKHRRETPLSR